MKPRMVQFYIEIAEKTAELSRAERLKVGSILVKEDKIISFGFNGTPSGWDNDCEDVEWMPQDPGAWLDPDEVAKQWPHIATHNRYKLVTKPEVLHAEANALMKVARGSESALGATLFVTHVPCIHCAKLIYQAGIDKVYFRSYYRTVDGLEFLARAGIPVINVEREHEPYQRNTTDRSR